MRTLLLRLQGLLASLAILAFAVGTPFLLFRIDGVPSFSQFTWTSLTAPDDGTLALEVIKALAWLFWAIFAILILLAIPAEIRGLQPPRIPGLALPQGAARQLVATAALAFTSLPTNQVAASPEPVNAVPVALVDNPTPTDVSTPDHPHEPPDTSIPDPAVTPHDQSSSRTKLHTVQRGESLWKIAEKYLGDGSRYGEIRDLNPAVLGENLDFLKQGVILRVPDVPAKPSATDETYVVQPGDTLSEIAANELGDGDSYLDIVEASRQIIQPDGAHLTDPDLIRPGWNLTIPNAAPADRHEDGRPRSDPHRDSRPKSSPPSTITPAPPRHPTPPVPTEPAPTVTNKADADSSRSDQVPDSGDAGGFEFSSTPAWVLPGLTGAGALLAASLLVVLRQHRRTQLRHRRPGHMITPPSNELLPAAKTLRLAEEPGLRRIVGLDRLLRTFPTDGPPPLVTADISDDAVTLHLAEPARLRAPWQGDGREWSAPLDADVETGERCAAYPLLVTLGSDSDGHHWLLNLEHVQAITITGDPSRAQALLRFITAELAANRWSSRACVDALGISAELSVLDPDRLRHHADDDTDFLDWLATDIKQGADGSDLAPDRYHVLATTNSHRGAAESILKHIAHDKTGAAVVMIAPDDSAALSTGARLNVASDGRLQAASLGLTLNAAGLTADEATVSAALVDTTRTAVNTEIPVQEHLVSQIDTMTDQSGSLRPDLVGPRPVAPDEPAGPKSNLPDAGTAYEAAAATTAEDVRAVAPVVREEVSDEVLSSDRDLDNELMTYLDPDARVPKLSLLGPLNAHCYGQPLVNRKPFFIELLTYLVLHPDGVTAPRAADAFHTRPERIHTEMGILRNWLGARPGTSDKYLPNATKSTRTEDNGKGIYRVRGVLCDLDLFRRLRARGQARGTDGIEDLISAFDLVTGEPFSEGRSNGWSWLEDDLTETITRCAIVDVAHVLITHALAVEDHDLAWRVAEKIVAIVPADDIARLDAIQVAAATGHTNLAVQQLIDEVYNRSDDDLGPIELPERATEIIERHHLDQLARRTRHRG
ncbi:putative LysM domain protein [Nocardioidaceae bacterium Broad-1]|nr:putative LysM domain protein [Nocardioidaceae bacterium Broad-1]